jgi:hypothetical protein
MTDRRPYLSDGGTVEWDDDPWEGPASAERADRAADREDDARWRELD